MAQTYHDRSQAFIKDFRSKGYTIQAEGDELIAYPKGMTPRKMPSYKKGGKVKKTGLAKVHKGERVLTKEQSAKFEKAKKSFFGIKKYGKEK